MTYKPPFQSFKGTGAQMECTKCHTLAAVEIKTVQNKQGDFRYYRYFNHYLTGTGQKRCYDGAISNLEIWGFA